MTRYLTYAIQFVTSLIIAVKLGPFYMGIWGFVLLVLNYLGQFHFGIANSLNVLLVQHKDSQSHYNKYITNSLMLMMVISLIIGLAYIYYVLIGIPKFEEYQVGKYMWAVCLIAIFQYFNGIFANIFRVKNMLNSISFTQTVVVILPFIVIFIFKGSQLVDALVASYLISNLLCVFYAIFSGVIPLPQKDDLNINTQKEILVKGIYLFLYNTCFAFIVISIRTIVSSYYSIEEFGLFTFAYTLGNAIMMLMDAFAFIAFPKVISIFSSQDNVIVEEKVMNVRNIYMTAAHFITYLFLLIMPLLSFVMPQYRGSIIAFNLIVLALALNTNNFAHSSFLIARNKERTAALIALVALILNIVISLVLVKVFNVTFNNVVIATIFANLFICGTCYYICGKVLGIKIELMNFFPIRLLVPYCIAVLVSVFGWSEFLWMPLALFVILNLPDIKCLINMGLRIAKDSTVVNI